MQPVEIITAFFTIRSAVANDVVGDAKHLMGNSHGGLLESMSSREALPG